MSSSDDMHDMQLYLDTLRERRREEGEKENLGLIQESNDCVMLTAEALQALKDADAVTEQILEEDAGMGSDDEDGSKSKTSGLLKSLEGKKGIYYVKLSNKEAMEVKLIDEGTLTSAKAIKTVPATTAAVAYAEREKIYEFDEAEDETVVHSLNNAEVITGGSTAHLERKTSLSPENVMHQCPKCTYATNKRFMLSRHMQTHSDARPFKCSVCSRGFKISAALVNHMNAHLGKKPHACSSCEMRFNTSGELLRHVRYKHTGEKPHKCGECDYSSVELSKMRRHMRCHTGERPYQCPHCTYASIDTFKLKRHLRTHTGEKPYECDICFARFTQSNTLKAHRLIHTAGDRPAFQCEYCPTTCGRKTDLQLHVQKLHNPEHPVKCKRCGKELPDRYSYKVHLKTHEGEKCFRCTICPYASISQRHLDMHMLVHTDEKPFTCEHCDACFRQRPLLVRHMNLYHNEHYVPPAPSEKSHVCPHCNRAFTRKGNLMRHMETHDSQVDKQVEKLKLKMGRQIRIKSDGTIAVPTDGRLDGLLIKKDPSDNAAHNDAAADDDDDYDDDDEYIDDDEFIDGDDQCFSILEIEDDDHLANVVNSGGGNSATGNSRVLAYQPLTKNSNATTTLLTAIKKESSSSLKQKMPKQVKVKTESADDENQHFMVIEVVDGGGEEVAGDDDGSILTIDDPNMQGNIIALRTNSAGHRKRNTANSLLQTQEYIIPENCKASQITILDIIEDE